MFASLFVFFLSFFVSFVCPRLFCPCLLVLSRGFARVARATVAFGLCVFRSCCSCSCSVLLCSLSRPYILASLAYFLAGLAFFAFSGFLLLGEH